MSVEVGRQSAEFFLAAVTGIGLGLLYDLGRGIRRERPGFTAVVDILFALALFLSPIFLSIPSAAVCTRGLRLYQCLGIFLGAGTYFLTASPLILRLWRRFLRMLARGREKILRTLKKTVCFLRKLAKKLFSTWRKWSTMNCVLRSPKRRSVKEQRR